jgi:hypothetical protein
MDAIYYMPNSGIGEVIENINLASCTTKPGATLHIPVKCFT